MVRSGSSQTRGGTLVWPVALAALVAAGSVAGCSTTQQEAARLQLNSARIRAGEAGIRVTVPGRAVRVTRVALVAGAGRTAFVVQVRNPAARAVSDLPISVGVRVAGRAPVYVNTQSGLEYFYFDAHLPVVPAKGTLTWVYTADRRLPAGARPFAIVGGEPSPPAAGSGSLPVIRATVHVPARPPAAGSMSGTASLTVTLRNLSGVPQYQLPVYAVAQAAGRYVAAGDLTVVHLGSQSTKTLQLDLLGNLDDAPVQVEALPTIFQ